VKWGQAEIDSPAQLFEGHDVSSLVRLHVKNGGRVWAWNSLFEWAIWSRCLKLPGKLEQFRCIMSIALAHGLPGALDRATRLANSKHRKSLQGKGLISKLCKPNKKLGGRLATPADFPEDFAAFGRYCQEDTLAEFEMLRRLPDLSPEEWKVFQLDREINERGVFVDQVAARAALHAVSYALAPINAEAIELSGGIINNVATQHQRVLQWLQARGFKYDTTRKEILLRIIAKHRADLAPEVVKMIDLRLQAARSSTSKLEAVAAGVMSDGRIRGTMKFCGAARTGRWSAQRPLQVHNFPRPQDKFTPADQQQVIDWLTI
jgi:DNA polymerase